MKDTEILKSLKLDQVDEETRQNTLHNINMIVELRVAGLIEDIMTKTQAAEFAKKSESDSPEAVKKWVDEKVVNTTELYESVLADYLEEKQKKN